MTDLYFEIGSVLEGFANLSRLPAMQTIDDALNPNAMTELLTYSLFLGYAGELGRALKESSDQKRLKAAKLAAGKMKHFIEKNDLLGLALSNFGDVSMELKTLTEISKAIDNILSL